MHGAIYLLLFAVAILLAVIVIRGAFMSKHEHDEHEHDHSHEGGGGEGEHHHCECCREIAHALREIAGAIGKLVPPSASAPVAFTISQISIGANMPTNNSIVAGTSGVFVATPQPPGSVIPAGAAPPTWVADDPNVSITTDATGLIATVSVPASDTAVSFNLGLSGPDGAAGATITGGPVLVTITQAGAGAPTSFAIAQQS